MKYLTNGNPIAPLLEEVVAVAESKGIKVTLNENMPDGTIVELPELYTDTFEYMTFGVIIKDDKLAVVVTMFKEDDTVVKKVDKNGKDFTPETAIEAIMGTREAYTKANDLIVNNPLF